MTSTKILELVRSRPGLPARRISQVLRLPKGQVDRSLRVLFELGLVERLRAPPRDHWSAPHYLYNPGPMALHPKDTP